MARLLYRLALVVGGLMLVLVTATRFASGGQGDPVRGEAIYDGDVAVCSVCHMRGRIAPPAEGTAERVLNVRLAAAGNRHMTVEQYLAESILYPNRYVAPGYTGYSMMSVYGRILSLQDIQDLVAYMLTL